MITDFNEYSNECDRDKSMIFSQQERRIILSSLYSQVNYLEKMLKKTKLNYEGKNIANYEVCINSFEEDIRKYSNLLKKLSREWQSDNMLILSLHKDIYHD